ncbi:LysE family transporter [Streptomyces sp. DSM 41982]|uniref:LysE family transporter n=1 Tax=Streptomyces evansiae TaxID=3075535 RepID=A0ABD5E1G3_9ACTN|nr:LysE family transporter [Streptomyces sp. DSM 41982]MDT0414135.1 LysE family transporter [Streptomyces sp. DSM 41982]
MNAPLPPAALGGFALAVLPFVVTPGASLALVTRHPARAAPVVLGTVGGLYAHAALVTAGLAALLANHPHVLLALRLAGAGYLVLLGVRLWRAEGGGEGEERTGDDADGVGAAVDDAAGGCAAGGGAAGDSATGNDRASGRAGDAGEGRAGWRLGVEALLANVLNPKALSLYLVLLPRFLHTHGRVFPQVLTLTTVHALLHTAWLLGWAHLAGRGPHRAAGRGVRRGLAVVLVGAGLWNVVA